MTLLILIIQTALTALDGRLSGKANTVINLADAMVDIISKAKTIYEVETGKPLDVDKIKPYVPLP